MTNAATMQNGTRREKQTRFLSQAIQLEESVNPHIIRATMSTISLAILGFFVWAGFTNINEVTRTPGEVVPYGYQQTVQHLEGGIVKAIHVREGDVVEKGEVILTLNDAGVREDLERATSKQLFLGMQAERLRAFIEGRDADFSRFSAATDNMIADQAAFLRDTRNAMETESQVIREQILQKEQTLASLKSSLETARQNLKITDEIYKRRDTLNKQGYASDVQLLEDKRRLNAIRGEIKMLEGQILAAKNETGEFQSRLESLSARYRSDANEKLGVLLAEKDQNIKTIRKIEERIGRMEVRSSEYGLVKGLSINTIGSVVQPAQTIAEIVPLNKHLEVQVKISPKDIGHISVGQPVQVKFSTYDFSRYGSVPGTLDRISATTFTAENGERYYEGLITLKQSHVGKNASDMILPGMTVMADVITGRKTILEYLFRPIHISLKTALTER